VDFLGLYQGTLLAWLGSYSFGHVWIRKDYSAISLVVFSLVFSSYFHIITCHIPVSICVSMSACCMPSPAMPA